jgi:predicted outer membrane protein
VVDTQREELIGILASQLSPNSSVAAFGQTLATNEADGIVAAQAALAQQGLPMPQLSAADEQAIQQLATLNGQQFETQFLNQLVQEQQTELAAAQQEMQTGTALAVRSYAAGQVPILQSDLQIAEQLLAQLQGSVGGV